MTTEGSDTPAVRQLPLFRRNLVSGYLYTTFSGAQDLLLVPLLGRGLGPTRYGVWVTLFFLVRGVSTICLWLGPVLVYKFGQKLLQGGPELATAFRKASQGYGALCFVVVLVGLFALTRDRLQLLGGQVTPEVRVAVAICAVWTIVVIQAQVRSNLLVAANRQYVVHFAQITNLVVTAGAAGVAMAHNGGLVAVAGSYALGSLIMYITFRLTSSHLLDSIRGTEGVRLSDLRPVWRLAYPYVLACMGSVLFTSDVVLLAMLVSSAEVARYAVALKVAEAGLQIIWRLSDTTQPYIVQMDARNDRQGICQILNKVAIWSVAAGATASVVLFTVGHPLFLVWVGPELAPSVFVIRVLAVYIFLQSFQHPSLVVPWSLGRMTIVGRMQLLEAVVKVVLAVGFVSLFGIGGMPMASVIALIGCTLWYVPASTFRWLQLAPAPFLGRTALVSLLLAIAAALGIYVGNSIFGRGSFPALGGTLALVALCAGAAFGCLRFGPLRAITHL